MNNIHDIPYKVRIVVPIRERDDQFIKLQEMIDYKRKMLLEKQNKFRVISRQNRFLEAIKEDYEKYNQYIVQQKRDQITALQILDNYIKELTLSGKLSENNIEDAKVEQANILKELDTIKRNLDSIINDTQEVLSNRN